MAALYAIRKRGEKLGGFYFNIVPTQLEFFHNV